MVSSACVNVCVSGPVPMDENYEGCSGCCGRDALQSDITYLITGLFWYFFDFNVVLRISLENVGAFAVEMFEQKANRNWIYKIRVTVTTTCVFVGIVNNLCFLF